MICNKRNILICKSVNGQYYSLPTKGLGRKYLVREYFNNGVERQSYSFNTFDRGMYFYQSVIPDQIGSGQISFLCDKLIEVFGKTKSFFEYKTKRRHIVDLKDAIMYSMMCHYPSIDGFDLINKLSYDGNTTNEWLSIRRGQNKMVNNDFRVLVENIDNYMPLFKS